MKICSLEDMKSLDNTAIEKYGVSSEVLMENAGNAAYYSMSKEFNLDDKRTLVFCGIGNNGGDGLVIARKIYSNGGKVKVVLLGSKDKLKGAAAKNFKIASNMKLQIRQTENIEEIMKEIQETDIIVDAIFGTGLTRNVEGSYLQVINLINGSKKTVFSIDIPSGINGNNGKVMGVAVEAKYTITLGIPKLGNIFYPGYKYCGKLYVSHISFPPSIYKNLDIQLNNPVPIPERKEYGHKGDFGDVLFIAGAQGYYGAPYLSTMSFLKTGGGYSRLATPNSVMSVIAQKGNEIVFVPMDATESGSISLENGDKILELAQKASMVVIGPGLSLNDETQLFVRELCKRIEKPLLIDGDGLTAVTKDLHVVKNRKSQTILTPHVGEMARITGKTIEEIEENKLEVLKEASKILDSIIVLKGGHSLIGYSDGTVYVNMSGNSGMATAGSGDVLTGVISAMLGLGQSVDNGVRTGVFIHGLAGDLAAHDKGKDGLTAQDIMEYLPFATKEYREEFERICEKYSFEVV